MEGAYFAVIVCCRNEDQTAGRDHRATVVFASGRRHAFSRQLWVLAQRSFKQISARVQINGVQRAPWWFDGRVSFLIFKFAVAGENIASPLQGTSADRSRGPFGRGRCSFGRRRWWR